MVQIDMEMPEKCQQCIFHIKEMYTDLGWYCNCALTETRINLLLHNRSDDCPLKEVEDREPPHMMCGEY